MIFENTIEGDKHRRPWKPECMGTVPDETETGNRSGKRPPAHDKVKSSKPRRLNARLNKNNREKIARKITVRL